MADIGSPLKIDTRRNVQERVFAGGAGQINTKVPRGKLAMLSGQDLDAAVRARSEATSELMSMAVVGAEIYNNNEKLKDKKEQLRIEGEYSRFQTDKQKEFAQAHTSHDKGVVRDSYKAGIAKLNNTVGSKEWNTFEQKAWAQGLELGARKIGADFDIKYNHLEFKETITGMKVQLADNERDFANKANIDPMGHLDIGIKIIEEMHELGAITKPEMLSRIRAYEKNATLARGSLLATLWAREKRKDPSAMPPRKELIAALQGQLGLIITHDLLEPLNKVLVESFLDEIKYGNKMASYEETVQAIEWKEERQKIDKFLKDSIVDGSANGKIFKEAIDAYSVMGDTDKILETQELRIAYENNQTPNRKLLDYYTNPQGIGFQRFIAMGTEDNPNPFMEGLMLNVEEAMSSIKNIPADDEFGHNDAATLLAIERSLHAFNSKVKNNEVDDARIYHIANMALLSYIQNAGGDSVGLAKREHLQRFLELDKNTLNMLETNGQQMTNLEWGALMFKKSPNYKSILDAISTDIDMEILRDRKGIGLYSNEGFKRATQVWSRDFQKDVKERLFNMLKVANTGSDPVDLSSASSQNVATTLNKATNPQAQNNFTTKSDKSTLSTANKVAQQNKATISDIQQQVVSGGATGNSPTAVIHNAGSKIASNKSKKKQVKPKSTQSGDVPFRLSVDDFSEDIEPEISAPTLADQQAILQQKNDQKVKMFSDAFNWVSTKSNEYNEWNSEMWKKGTDYLMEAMWSDQWGVEDLLSGNVAENIAERFGFSGFELKSRDKVWDDEIKEIKEWDTVIADIKSGKKATEPTDAEKIMQMSDQEIKDLSDTKITKQVLNKAIDFSTGKATGKPTNHAQLNGEKVKFIESINKQVTNDMSTITELLKQKVTQPAAEIPDWAIPKHEKVDIPKEQVVFDPLMAQQIIKPIVEEVTKSIQMSLAPEIQEPPSMTREQSARNTEKYLENIGQPPVVGEDGLTEAERDEVRRYPLYKVREQQKDAEIKEHHVKPDNPIDFDNKKKMNRWIELYNKNLANKLTAKEQEEFKRLVKYLNTRGLLPQG